MSDFCRLISVLDDAVLTNTCGAIPGADISKSGNYIYVSSKYESGADYIQVFPIDIASHSIIHQTSAQLEVNHEAHSVAASKNNDSLFFVSGTGSVKCYQFNKVGKKVDEVNSQPIKGPISKVKTYLTVAHEVVYVLCSWSMNPTTLGGNPATLNTYYIGVDGKLSQIGSISVPIANSTSFDVSDDGYIYIGGTFVHNGQAVLLAYQFNTNSGIVSGDTVAQTSPGALFGHNVSSIAVSPVDYSIVLSTKNVSNNQFIYRFRFNKSSEQLEQIGDKYDPKSPVINGLAFLPSNESNDQNVLYGTYSNAFCCFTIPVNQGITGITTFEAVNQPDEIIIREGKAITVCYSDPNFHGCFGFYELLNFTNPVLSVTDTPFGFSFSIDFEKLGHSWSGIIKILNSDNQLFDSISMSEVGTYYDYNLVNPGEAFTGSAIIEVTNTSTGNTLTSKPVSISYSPLAIQLSLSAGIDDLEANATINGTLPTGSAVGFFVQFEGDQRTFKNIVAPTIKNNQTSWAFSQSGLNSRFGNDRSGMITVYALIRSSGKYNQPDSPENAMGQLVSVSKGYSYSSPIARFDIFENDNVNPPTLFFNIYVSDAFNSFASKNAKNEVEFTLEYWGDNPQQISTLELPTVLNSKPNTNDYIGAPTIPETKLPLTARSGRLKYTNNGITIYSTNEINYLAPFTLSYAFVQANNPTIQIVADPRIHFNKYKTNDNFQFQLYYWNEGASRNENKKLTVVTNGSVFRREYVVNNNELPLSREPFRAGNTYWIQAAYINNTVSPAQTIYGKAQQMIVPL